MDDREIYALKLLAQGRHSCPFCPKPESGRPQVYPCTIWRPGPGMVHNLRQYTCAHGHTWYQTVPLRVVLAQKQLEELRLVNEGGDDSYD